MVVVEAVGIVVVVVVDIAAVEVVVEEASPPEVVKRLAKNSTGLLRSIASIDRFLEKLGCRPRELSEGCRGSEVSAREGAMGRDPVLL